VAVLPAMEHEGVTAALARKLPPVRFTVNGAFACNTMHGTRGHTLGAYCLNPREKANIWRGGKSNMCGGNLEGTDGRFRLIRQLQMNGRLTWASESSVHPVGGLLLPFISVVSPLWVYLSQ